MPVLKVKKDGVWEELGGTSPMNGGNADTLDGKYASYFATASDVNGHISNVENPHNVTAEQVGTYTKNEIDNKLSLAGEVKILDSDDNVDGIIEVPVLSVERVDGGTRITATDNNGVTISMLYDGAVTFEGLTDEQKESLRGADGYSPVRGIDYWTDSDKAEIKSYVDEAILGGAW